MEPTGLAPAIAARLAASTLLRGLDPDDPALLQGLELREADAGRTLLAPDRDNAEILVLLEGELLVTVQAQAMQPLARIHPGECVGELSLLDQGRPSGYVVTARPSRYLAISREQLWRLLDARPVIARNLLHILAERAREKNSLLVTSLGLLQEYRLRAETDALTGLHNRAWMAEIFPRQLELSLRIGHPVSALLIDIDHFKRVNDDHGHAVGDRALQHLARVLADNLRSTDLLARYGGEELVVLMPATPGSKARASGERLRRCVARAPLALAEGGRLALTVSIGVAQCLPGWGLDDLLQAADRALYAAKHAGRDQVRLAESPFGA